jgi:hypothetical protein
MISYSINGGGIVMKKWLAGIILAALLVTYSVCIYAKYDKFEGGSGRAYNAPGHYRERDDAGYIIHRTATSLFKAQQAADRGHHYYGLGQAVAHQQKARELYWAGSYREAIYHSLRARDLAFTVMNENRERPRREYYRDDIEQDYGRSAPRAKDLDIRIDSVKVGKGDALVHLHFGLDINQ